MTTILIKKKDTAGAPAPGDLTNAAGGTEIAVNTATKRIYTKDSGGNVVELGTNATSSTIVDLTVTTSTTLSYGTANQVQYLNGSKLLVGSANMTFNGTTLTVAGFSNTGNEIIGTNSSNTLTVNALVNSNLLFTDNTYDIGASGATRPRNLYLAGTATIGSTVTLSGGTANGVVYLNGSNQVTTGSALTYNGLQLTNSQNTNQGAYIVNRNANTGTAATAYFNSDVTAGFTGYSGFGSRSSGYTTSGMLEANSGGIFTSGLTNGLNIMTLDGYPVKFGIGNAEVARFTSAGNFVIGTTSVTAGTKFNVTGNNVTFTPNTAGKDTHTFSTVAADVGSYSIKSDTTTNVYLYAGGTSYIKGGDLAIGSSVGLSGQAGRTDLTVNGSSTAIISMGVGGVRQGYLYTPSSGIILTSETNTLNLQTSGAYPITFNTNNAEAGRFSASGQFSIGTTGTLNYGTRLSVLGTTNAGYGAEFYVPGSNNTTKIAFANDSSIAAIGSIVNNLVFYAPAATEVGRFTSAGNFGVNSSAPVSRISAVGNSATTFYGLTLRNANGATGSSAILNFEASTGTEGDAAASAAQIRGIREGAGTNGAMSFWTGAGGTPTERARMVTDGSVLVATTARGANADLSSTQRLVVGNSGDTSGAGGYSSGFGEFYYTGTFGGTASFLIRNGVGYLASIWSSSGSSSSNPVLYLIFGLNKGGGVNPTMQVIGGGTPNWTFSYALNGTYDCTVTITDAGTNQGTRVVLMQLGSQ